MAKLINKETQEERQLVKAVTIIGRAEYCDVCVRERIVSREHARILRKLTGYYIEDLGSTHGTGLNNLRIQRRARLHDGDVITIAAVRDSSRGTAPRPAPHTDTLVPDARAHGAEAAEADGPVVGATFIFRK
jgi:pSer/pThr/pTyr-binding forkhead associated (FHA) protein